MPSATAGVVPRAHHGPFEIEPEQHMPQALSRRWSPNAGRALIRGVSRLAGNAALTQIGSTFRRPLIWKGQRNFERR